MKYFLLFILVLAFISSCNSVSPEQLNCDKKIIVDNILFENAPNDSSDFDNVEIVKNCLKITVFYSGGCGNVEFNLVASEMIMESYPPQMNIRLSLKDEDHCKAYIMKEISFDLSPIHTLVSNQVILHLENWDEVILYRF